MRLRGIYTTQRSKQVTQRGRQVTEKSIQVAQSCRQVTQKSRQKTEGPSATEMVVKVGSFSTLFWDANNSTK